MSFNKCMFCKHCVQNSLEKYMCLNSEVGVGLVDLNNECDEFIVEARIGKLEESGKTEYFDFKDIRKSRNKNKGK